MKEKLCGDVIIELTRRCNMSCQHCLRGCSQAIDMSKDMIRSVLDEFDAIWTLTFTGGEPSLVPNLISYAINYIIEKNIPLNNFYIVTNGKTYSQSMIRALRRAYQYADEKDMCCLTVSVDHYHDDNHDNRLKYEREMFYREDKINPNIDQYLINEGRAYENGIGVRNLRPNTSIPSDSTCFDTNDNGNIVVELRDSLIYVSAVGDVLLDCDLSYDNQELFSIGNIKYSKLADIIIAHIYDE